LKSWSDGSQVAATERSFVLFHVVYSEKSKIEKYCPVRCLHLK
jgi:hypothetical protein